jgi:hypothetical protein
VKPTNDLQPLIDALLARFNDSDEGLTTIVDLTVLVAMADGRIDEAEMTALMGTIETLMGTRLSLAVAKHLVTQSRSQIRNVGAAARARDVGASLAAHSASEEGVRLALAIAWTSEGVSAEEHAIIGVVAATAGVAADRLQALADEATPAGAA